MSTSYQVDLVFGTRSANSALAQMEAKLRGLERQAQQAGGRDAFRNIGDSADRNRTKVEALAGAVKGAIAAVAASQALRFVFGQTAEVERQTKSIEVLTGSVSKAKDIVAELQTLGAATPFTSTELIETARQLKAFGVETEKLVGTTRRLADVSGATGAELQGLALAYGQVMAKGRLQGEELLQFTERGVALQGELQKMYGLSGEEIREAMEKGRIGAEAVEVAVIRLTNAGGQYANGAIAQSQTLSGKLSTLQDNVQGLARTLGEALTPAFKTALDLAIGGVSTLQQMLGALQLTAFDAGAWVTEAFNFGDRFGLGGGFKAYEARRQATADARKALVAQINGGFGVKDLGDWTPRGAVNPKTPALLDGRGGSKTGKGADQKGPDFPAYITSQQFGRWLQAEYGATIKNAHGFDMSGYRASNHRTPDHARNAMDIFFLGPLGQATQRTKALERTLRATGAFGSQLFGPISDPGGHGGDRNLHVHAPTPGGRVKMNAALARLMGLTGKGSMAGEMAGWENQIAEDAAKAAEARQQGLAAAQDTLRVNQQSLALSQASTESEKLRVAYGNEQADIKAKYGRLLTESKSTEETATLQKAQQLELDRAQLEYTVKINDALLRRVGISGELLDQSRFTGTGAGVRGQTFDFTGTYLDSSPAEEKVNRLEQVAETVSGAYGQLFRDIVSGTATAEEALGRMFQSIADSFTDMVAQMLTEWAKAQIMGLFTRGGGAAAGGAGVFGATSSNLFSQGLGIAGSLLSFDGGGFTGRGGRSGGLDGRGGFAAILHPNETVIDHTRGQAAGAVNSVVNVSIASDGSAQVDASQGSAMGREVEAAVVAVLARQRRPGGILAGRS